MLCCKFTNHVIVNKNIIKIDENVIIDFLYVKFYIKGSKLPKLAY